MKKKILNLVKCLVEKVKRKREYSGGLIKEETYYNEGSPTKFLDIEDANSYLRKKLEEVRKQESHQELEKLLYDCSFEVIETLSIRLFHIIVMRQRSIAEIAFRNCDYQLLIFTNLIYWHLNDLTHNVPTMLNKLYFYSNDNHLKGVLIEQFIMPFYELQIVTEKLPNECSAFSHSNILDWLNVKLCIEEIKKKTDNNI